MLAYRDFEVLSSIPGKIPKPQPRRDFWVLSFPVPSRPANSRPNDVEHRGGAACAPVPIPEMNQLQPDVGKNLWFVPDT
jgi:hypothetical protein